ncbi:MAG: sporulation integral membrane protein YtvI [Sedimentibacter sp.]
MTENDKKKFIVNVAFVVTVYAVSYFIFVYMIHWVMPFLVGFLIALALRPLTKFVNKLVNNTGKGVAIFVVALFYAVAATIIWLLLTFLITQTTELIRIMPKLYFSKLEPLLLGFNDWIVANMKLISPDAADAISQVITNSIDYFANGVKNVSINVVQFITKLISNFPLYLISIIFTIILSVFISVEYSNLTAFIKRQLPDKFNSTFSEARIFLNDTLWKMIKAYMIIMSITFIELLVGLNFLKASYALPIAAIVSILDILPIIGTGGVLIPWAITELISENYRLGGGLLILYVVITVVRNIIEPRIVGHQIGLHPIITITAMYAGLRLFGFVGFLTAPIITILVKYLNDTGKISLFK